MHRAQQFVDLIRAQRRFLLTGHEYPDGDCLGAEVALYQLLRALGKDVTVINPDPAGPSFDFLEATTPMAAFRPGDALPEVDVVCLLDCAWFSRTGAMAEPLRQAVAAGAIPAVVDHHVGSEDGDGQVSFVDPGAAATGELVYRLFAALEVPLDGAAATGVFVSLASDTGWFRYSNTTPAVLRLAGELTAHGLEPSRVYDLLHRRNHPDAVDLLRQGLERTRVLLDGRLGVLCLDKPMMDRVSRVGYDTDQLMEPLRAVAGMEVVALLKERFDGDIKLSLRASHDVDVQAIAASFGGGGHRKAAGATVAQPLEAVIGQVETQVRDALEAGPSRGADAS